MQRVYEFLGNHSNSNRNSGWLKNICGSVELDVELSVGSFTAES